MLPEPYASFRTALKAVLPDSRIYTDPLRTLAYGTDASFYRLVPKIVVDVVSEEEVVEVLRLAKRHKTPLTFRAAGTSLSGQAVTDSVLVRLTHGWRGCKVNADASAITLQPGVIGAYANKVLAPLGRKIGPDPASIDSCMIGGMVANNSSGMCCGVADNSYKTLLSSRLILADGTVLDTADAASRAAFNRSHAHILEGLASLRATVMADKKLAERIRHKFKIKNTTGYSINALVDFDDPVDILQHLMVGSEGTLGFIAEVTYRTVEEHAFKASSFMLFPTVQSACAAAALLSKEPVAAVELMDRASLRSVEGQPGIPADLAELDSEVCSLLVETRAGDKAALSRQIKRITKALDALPTVCPVVFSTDVQECAALWSIRKGILPTVGAVRAVGSSCLIEDVAVPVEALADASLDLQRLFKEHGYGEAALFGHALDGNLHFVFNQAFGTPKEIARYRDFMDAVCRMITEKYDGSLKAEHGTGRNMAPFVEMEWGKQAYRLMCDLKTLLDPDKLLNPGVVINSDAEAHIKALKPLHAAHELVDKCTECGFCESVCPSRRLTLTPRQRIASWREIQRLGEGGTRDGLLKALEKTYRHDGRDTCAADGMCATRCPANINTGSFIKHLRGEQADRVAHAVAKSAHKHFGAACAGASLALRGANALHGVLGPKLMQLGSDTLRVVSLKKSPAWNRAIPTGGSPLPAVGSTRGDAPKVVYFPSCISRNMGPALADKDRRTEPQLTVSLLLKAGYEVLFPDNVHKLCCGTVFASKGFTEQAGAQAAELNAALLAASDNGRYPVLTETSPCLQRMQETLDKRLQLYEPVRFVLEHLQGKLAFTKLPRSVAVHATCSTRKMGLADQLAHVAALCAETVVCPEGTDCCGFAGDRGFTHPELNASALLDLRRQVSGCDAGYSSSRTCSIGLTLHGGIPYYSILALVDEATTGIQSCEKGNAS